MNQYAGHYTLELTKSFRDNLETYRDDWLLLPSKAKQLNQEKFESALFNLFQSQNAIEDNHNKLVPPKIVRVSSIFQLTNAPLIVSLMVADHPTQKFTNLLRRDLNTDAWQKLWSNLDAQISETEIKHLKASGAKSHQQSSLKEINKFLRMLHESTGSTFDTTDSPKLSSIGLQINSTLLADAKALALSLEEEICAVVSGDCIDKVKNELGSIPPVFERLETQLGLQIIPNILAETVRSIKEKLVENHENLTDELAQDPNRFPELLKLIYQADLENRSSNIRAVELWGGARIGAYGDPAVRLIASSLQLDLFRQSLIFSWLPFHLYMRDQLPGLYSDSNNEKLSWFADLLESAYAFVLYDNICFVAEYPTHASLDPEGRYHNESGPSLIFSDQTRVFSWHGRNVPSYIIEKPESITIDKIDNERNIELRTILIDRYGISKFLEDSEAKVIQQDKYGTLFQRNFRNDEPLLVVMVKNSTPEPDGTYKHYFLRVPPNTLTAKAGIAWTFGISESEYEPDIET